MPQDLRQLYLLGGAQDMCLYPDCKTGWTSYILSLHGGRQARKTFPKRRCWTARISDKYTLYNEWHINQQIPQLLPVTSPQCQPGLSARESLQKQMWEALYTAWSWCSIWLDLLLSDVQMLDHPEMIGRCHPLIEITNSEIYIFLPQKWSSYHSRFFF